MIVFSILFVSYSLFLQVVCNEVLNCSLRKGPVIEHNFSCTKHLNVRDNSSDLSHCGLQPDTLFINCSSILIFIVDGNQLLRFFMKKEVRDSADKLSASYQLNPNVSEQTKISTLCPTIKCQVTTKQPQDSYTSRGWVTLEQRQLRTIYNVSSYEQAGDHCKTVHQASLVMFASPLTYLNLIRTLNLTDEVFWVDDLLNKKGINLNDSSSMCLVLKVSNSSSILFTKPCSELHFSICSRSITADEILNQPEFEAMIQNMTLDKRQTARSRRQRQSADDNRVVSKALGCLGIGIICVVLGVVMLMDLTRFIHWWRCRCRCERKISRDTPLNTLENRQNKCTRL